MLNVIIYLIIINAVTEVHSAITYEMFPFIMIVIIVLILIDGRCRWSAITVWISVYYLREYSVESWLNVCKSRSMEELSVETVAIDGISR
jgi:hypothetical protein